MDVLKAISSKLGHFILIILKALRKVVCCKRRKEQECLLPMTINDVHHIDENTDTYDNTQWETWPDIDNMHKKVACGGTIPEAVPQNLPNENENENEDFFKDMVPQIRKTKKIYVKNEEREVQEIFSSNRLAMDPNAVSLEPDLGIIDDSPSSWDDIEGSNELWNPDALIREKKKIELEKRKAENQRRKQEKENRRVSKPESLSSMMMSLADSKDKHKCS